VIEARNVTKVYGNGVVAVKELSLRIARRELFCLLGANGAGKTTLINLFFNFIAPTEGNLFVNGIDCTEQPLQARRYAAYLSENVSLYEDLTAYENLEFFTRLGSSRKRTRDEYYEVLNRVGLREEFFHKDLRFFSKGMRQKVALAICLMREAPAMFLDEPTSGLDPQAAWDLMRVLVTEREQGKAILVATHDLFRARQVADRIGVMRSGRLVAVWSREDLEGENLERLYLDYAGAETGDVLGSPLSSRSNEAEVPKA